MAQSNPNLVYKKNELQWKNFSLKKISPKISTPFFLYSETILKETFLDFKNSAELCGINNPLIAFAVKANGNLEILKILRKLGSGADIVSGGELKRALEAGIPPEKIVFSGVGKTEEEIKLALSLGKNGIFSFNVESIEELELINRLAKKMNRIARVALRFNPQVKPKTHKYISTGNKTHKFGMLKDDIKKVLNSKNKFKHIHFAGLSIHIGSQLLNLNATARAIKSMGELAREYLPEIEFLDVGGGLGVDYHPSETKTLPTTHHYMMVVQIALTESFFKKNPMSRARVVFEPGRRIIAKSGIFVMNVLRTKSSDNHKFLIVDGGMNDFARPSLYDAYHEIMPIIKRSSKLTPTNVVGPICETSDCFAHNRPLPKLEGNDKLILGDAGAYGYSMSSNYNLRGKPAEYILDSKNKIKLIKKAQTYKEL